MIIQIKSQLWMPPGMHQVRSKSTLYVAMSNHKQKHNWCSRGHAFFIRHTCSDPLDEIEWVLLAQKVGQCVKL